jgi:hypothetical protein
MAKRLVFLALLGGGLLLWLHERKPRDFTLQIDLTQALPGDITEVDVVVRRSGHALARHDMNYGARGAPGLIDLPVHASPGAAEVETTLVYSGKPARRSTQPVELSEKSPSRITAQ